MPIPQKKHTILIMGASGFIGNALYKELLKYYDTYGTYCNQEGLFGDNHVFYKYDMNTDNSYEILETIQPTIIISALQGNFKAQFKAHQELVSYIMTRDCKLLFLSSFSVFDGKYNFPSYENDSTKAESEEGLFKISVEKMLNDIPSEKYTILRLPTVLGIHSPTIIQLQQAAKHHAAFEVYPTVIISATTADKIAQQVHYIINKNLSGIFHLASEDVTHHEDIFREIAINLSDKMPIFKQVFRRNEDIYKAILPKHNVLPKNYRITIEEVIEASALTEEIQTLKQ